MATPTMTTFRRSSGTNAEAEVRQLVTEWAEAVRREELAGILRYHWDGFFSWSHDPVRSDIFDMTVTAGDEVAFVRRPRRPSC
jgi:ketosteroid isomerase-like protein